jgi:GNAT superfamily N-acetyltransferase
VPELTILPATADQLADVAALFGTNGTSRGCYCTWFLIPTKECRAGWGAGNQATFEARARSETLPMGLLAYADGEPIGWCATGPRARFERALNATVLRQHDPAEDTSVWLVPCFFVRVGHRKQGVMRALLDGAVQLAAEHGATAVEGFPLAGTARRSTGDAYLGVEPLFADLGFAVVDRPTANRVVMRRDLAAPVASRRTASSARKRRT